MRIATFDNKSSFGKLVVRHLFINGETQKSLAYKLNITEGALSQLLNGKSKPSAKRLYDISHILNIDISILTDSVLEQ